MSGIVACTGLFQILVVWPILQALLQMSDAELKHEIILKTTSGILLQSMSIGVQCNHTDHVQPINHDLHPCPGNHSIFTSMFPA